MAQRWLALLAITELPVADLCRASYLQRPHQRYRLAIVATDATGFAQQLTAFLAEPAVVQVPALSRHFAPLSIADADNYWQLWQQADSLPADVLLPCSAELHTRWRCCLQQAEHSVSQHSATQVAATELLREQLALLLCTEAGIGRTLSEAPTVAPEQATELLLPHWPNRQWLLTQIASAYQQGADIHWLALQRWFGPAKPGTSALLPHYPYQKKTFWLDPLPQPAVTNIANAQAPALMNRRQQLSAVPDLCWYSLQFDRSQQFLAQHLIFNTPISPAAAHLAMLLTALPELGSSQPLSIRQLELHQPLVLSNAQRSVQLTLQGPLVNGGGAQLVAELRSSDDVGSPTADWLLHARAEIVATPDSLYQQQQRRLQQLWPQQMIAVAAAATAAAPWYQHLTGLGYQLGSGYQRIQQIWHSGPHQAWCRVEALSDQDSAGAIVAPGLMDSLLQTLICSVPDLIAQMQQGGWIYIPFSIGEVTQFAPLDQPYYWCFSESQAQGTLLTGRVLVFGADGQLKLLADEFAVKQTDQQALLGKFRPSTAPLCWRTEWQTVAATSQLTTAQATANLCYSVAPEGVLPQRWQDVLSHLQPAEVLFQHADKQVLILPALEFPPHCADGEAAAALELQTEWLRQQIPAMLATGQQLQLVLQTNAEHSAQSGAAHSGAICALQQVLRLEYPGQLADLLILPADCPPAVLQQALSTFDATPQGQIKRYQRVDDVSQWLQPRLVPADAVLDGSASSETASDGARLNGTMLYGTPLDGTALLTGGQSALGAVVLPQLFAMGATAVVICSRRAEPADFADWLAAVLTDPLLQQRVHWSHTDVCDATALARCLQWISTTLPPLQAIWHCAGQLADVSLARMSAAQLADVLAPKVRGSLNLHQLCQGLPLRQFVLFSSVAAVFGNFGQANYAIANGFMNGLAQLRAAQGLPGVALCFGPWHSDAAQGGMAQAQAGNISAQGYQWLTPQLLQPLWAALANASGQLVVAQADWPVLAGALQQPAMLQPLLQSQQNLPAASPIPGAANCSVDISYWRQLPRPQAELALQDWLGTQVEAITGLRVNFEQSLMAQGVDSLAAVTIRSTLSQQLALRLPVSLLFNFPTIPLLAGELCQQLFGAITATATTNSTAAEAATTQSFNYLEDLSEAELNALILQEFSAV